MAIVRLLRMLAPVTVASLLASACTAQIADEADRGQSDDDDGSSEETDSDTFAANCALAAAPAPVRRLTRQEYDNTVRDLLRDGSIGANGFAEDGKAGLFTSNVDTPVSSPQLARDYLVSAETLAARAVAKLGTLSPCTPGPDNQDACAREFIATFGKRVYRRPLEDVEVQRFVTLYAATRQAGEDFSGALRVVIATFLQSPKFLNHIERGVDQQDEDVVLLSNYEMASRLSYLLWGSMPDDDLFRAADDDALSSPTGIETQVRRLLQDPRGRNGVKRFYAEFLGLQKLEELAKNTTVFPDFTDGMGKLMNAETVAFVDDVMWDGDAKLDTLLLGSFSYVNEPLARIYDLDGITGNDLRRVELDADQRAGILTQPSFLALHAYSDQTSPVHRAVFVREALLCQHMPSPPDDVVVNLPPSDASLTTRERYTIHMKEPYCAGCHTMMNPIGLSMENYDGIGRYRTEENGFPIDASGDLIETEDIDGTYDGLIELSERLAGSGEVRKCMVKQWYSYAMGRTTSDPDTCSLAKLGASFLKSGGNMRELLVAVTTSDGFRHRGKAAEECQ